MERLIGTISCPLFDLALQKVEEDFDSRIELYERHLLFFLNAYVQEATIDDDTKIKKWSDIKEWTLEGKLLKERVSTIHLENWNEEESESYNVFGVYIQAVGSSVLKFIFKNKSDAKFALNRLLEWWES